MIQAHENGTKLKKHKLHILWTFYFIVILIISSDLGGPPSSSSFLLPLLLICFYESHDDDGVFAVETSAAVAPTAATGSSCRH